MTAGGEIPVELDRGDETPLPVQLAAQLREVIDAATLRPGERVPATRALASRLGVARGVVVAAYEQLIAEGYLSAEHGRGTRVNPALDAADALVNAAAGAERWRDGLHERDENAAGDTAAVQRGAAEPGASPALGAYPVSSEGVSAPQLSQPTVAVVGAPERAVRPGPLAPGIPITDTVVGPAWRAAWRAAAASANLIAPPLGDPELRSEIADHLRRMRGTHRAAGDVIVTAGTRDGLGLLLTALGTTRGRELVVGVEDPGLPSLREVAARYGARIVALPADADGLDTTALPDGLLDVVIVTPSHQYPLGGSLPLTRRRELIAWASAAGVVVVEDDYDSELRYTGSPLPTLAALDDPVAGVVVLLGTFSRTVAPSLSAGYLVAPRGLRARLEPVRRELGGPVSTVVQAALARYLASGELRRHTARMLKRYAARRDVVSEVFAGVNEVRVRPMDGGLHAVLEFAGKGQESGREQAVAGDAEASALGVAALSGYWQRGPSDSGMAGLVIGMGGADDAEFARALARLRVIIEAHLGTAPGVHSGRTR